MTKRQPMTDARIVGERARQQQQDEAATRARDLARQLAVETHRLHALNCPICQSDAFIVARMDELVKRVLEERGGPVDTEGQ
jgi:hypothetical protein